MMFAYIYTGGMIMIVAALVFLIWGRVRYEADRSHRSSPYNIQTILAACLAVATVFYFVTAASFQKAAVAQLVKYQPISQLPDTEQLRVVPFGVAEQFGEDGFQSPTEQLTDWQPQMWDGRFAYVSLRSPDGFIRYFTQKSAGVGILDASISSRKLAFDNQKLEVSSGVGVSDNIRWRIYERRYFIATPEVVYGKVNGQIIQIVPIVAFEGFWVRYPVFGGAFLVYPDGKMEELGPEEAKQHPAVLAAGRVIPESLARFYTEAHAFKRGIINAWFYHVDQVELSDIEGEQNGQPYLLHYTDGLAWTVAADPYGKAFGVFKIFRMHALSGQMEVLEIAQESALTGANRSVEYVKAARSDINWAGGNFTAIEPRPDIVNGELKWVTSITLSSLKGINGTVVIDAKNPDEVVSFTADEDGRLKAYLQTGQPVAVKEIESKPNQDSSREERIRQLESLLEQALRELKELRQ